MKSIYILDYDTDIVYVLCKWFSFSNFITEGFSTPEQLFVRLQAFHPYCIIVDCLPNNLLLTTHICHTIRHIHQYKGKLTITSTGILSQKDLKIFNADNFVAKPFDLVELLNAIEEDHN